MNPIRSRRGQKLPCVFLPILLFGGVLPARQAAGTQEPAAGVQEPEAHEASYARQVQALAGSDPVARDLARRQLALAERLPVAAIEKLLGAQAEAVVLAAVRLFRDRGLAHEALRGLAQHSSVAVRRLVVPMVETDALRAWVVEAGESASYTAIGIDALYELHDRGELGDELLLAAMQSPAEGLADAASRLVVHEIVPFPTAIVGRLAVDAPARRYLLAHLVRRPRASALAWLEGLLASPDLGGEDRARIIQTLPADAIDHDRALSLLGSLAQQEDVWLANEAAIAAWRLPPERVDRLVPEVLERVRQGASLTGMLRVLERVSPDGEKALLAHALVASATVRAEIFHWLDVRGSDLVATALEKALDGNEPFPPELLPLVSGFLDTDARVEVVAGLLTKGDPGTRAHAFAALADANVYHPAMHAATREDASGRRMWRLLQLPHGKLPEDLYLEVLAEGDLTAVMHAVDALLRSPLTPAIEKAVLDLIAAPAMDSLKTALCRVALQRGSEKAGLLAWEQLRGEEFERACRWVMERPRPWFYERLLRERERLQGTGTERVARQCVLIALTRLGDKGARAELIEELPRLTGAALRELRVIMSELFRPAELQQFARRLLPPPPRGKEIEAVPAAAMDDAGRLELLEWYLAHPSIDIQDVLHDIWTRDDSDELRLAALRGLLSADSETVYARLMELAQQPLGEKELEIAFEAVGSMPLPLSARAIEILARLVILTPLLEPGEEVGLAIRADRRSARSVYPIVLPITNLLRRADASRPGAGFARVAAMVGERRYALNRERLGLFLSGIRLRDALMDELGPVVARLILDAPDRSSDFVAPAQMTLAAKAYHDGDHAAAAALYAAAHRAFARNLLPVHVARAFDSDSGDPAGYHHLAALSSRAAVCRGLVALDAGDLPRARQHLDEAVDLAEGDRGSLHEVDKLRERLNR